jgi:tetratricopeptide (TPR) repeat protein
LDQAIIDLQSASHCVPAKAESLVALAAAYADKGDDDRAVAAFDAAIELRPNDAEAIRAAAMLDLRHERNERAIIKLEKLVLIESNSAQTHSDLGAAYAGTGSLDRARQHFDMALKLDPNNASALMGLGNSYLKAGQNLEAVTLLTKAAKSEPHAYEPRFLLASAYNALGRYAEAVAECKEALRLGGTDGEIYYRLARAYRGLGRKEEERKALERFSELRLQSNRTAELQREVASLINQAKPLVDDGKLLGAISLLETAHSLDRQNPQVLYRLAGLHYDLQHHQAARQYAREAIAISPSEWRYHYLLGLVEKASGRLEAARDCFETTLRLNPSAAEPINQLGTLAVSRRDFAQAIRYFEKAAQLDPLEPAYQLNLEAAQRVVSVK